MSDLFDQGGVSPASPASPWANVGTNAPVNPVSGVPSNATVETSSTPGAPDVHPADEAWNPFEAPPAAPEASTPEPLPVPTGLKAGGVVRQTSTGQIGLVVALGKLENDAEGRVRDAVVVAWLGNVSHPILAGEFEVL